MARKSPAPNPKPVGALRHEAATRQHIDQGWTTLVVQAPPRHVPEKVFHQHDGHCSNGAILGDSPRA